MLDDQETSQHDQMLSLEQVLALAQQLHHRGQLNDARGIYEAILGALPDQPEALNYLGILCYQQQHLQDAVGFLRRAVESSPGYADAHNNLGNVSSLLGELDQAEVAYCRAIELNPAHADAHNNLGILYRRQQRIEEAIEAYRKALAANPDFVDAYYNLGGLLAGQRLLGEAVAAFQETIVRSPRYFEAYKSLGNALYRLGRIEEAAKVYRRWLGISPDHPIALHMLAACTGTKTPVRASDDYVRTLFDRFAETFDQDLERLEYRAPQLIGQSLHGCLGAPAKALDILDAGCGTGLCAVLLRPFARTLVGVDLSEGMLNKARERQLYDRLIVAELSVYLEGQRATFDLLVSADTLVYFGELSAVFAAASRALRPGGRLVFTVEHADPEVARDGYLLTRSGRYSHTSAYLRRSLVASGFSIEALQRAHLRLENSEPVTGLVVSAQHLRSVRKQETASQQ